MFISKKDPTRKNHGKICFFCGEKTTEKSFEHIFSHSLATKLNIASHRHNFRSKENTTWGHIQPDSHSKCNNKGSVFEHRVNDILTSLDDLKSELVCMPNDVINKGFGKVQIHNYLSTWMLKLAFGIDWYIHYYSNGGSIREQADCYKSITSEDFFRTRDAVLSNSWNQPKCSVYYFELPKIHQGDGCEVAVFKESVVFKKGCHLIIMLRDGGLMYEFLNSENSQALLRKATDIDYEFAYYKLISCFRTYSILLHEFEWLDKKYLGRVFEEENAKDVYREEFALAYNASLVGTEFEEFNLGTEFSERKAIRDFIPNVFLKPCEFDYKHSKSWIERLFGG